MTHKLNSQVNLEEIILLNIDSGINYDENDCKAISDNILDNKGMVTTPQTERGAHPPPTIHLNIPEPADDRGRPEHGPPPKPWLRARCRCRAPYVINIVVAVFVLSMLLLLELGYIPGTQQGFVCKDPVLSQKFTGDTISITALLLGSFLLPIAVLLLAEFLSQVTFKRLRASIIWLYYKEFVIGVTLVLLLTEIGKVVFGEHRPHFLDVCQPKENKDCTEGAYIPTFTCTSTKYSKYFLVDTGRSFPSGHSSASVFASIFSVYVIQTRMPTTHTGYLLKPLLVGACLTWCLVCSLTRITDKRHHWWDVLAGSALGAAGALYSLLLLHPRAKLLEVDGPVSISTSTLLDLKNKDAKSEII